MKKQLVIAFALCLCAAVLFTACYRKEEQTHDLVITNMTEGSVYALQADTEYSGETGSYADGSPIGRGDEFCFDTHGAETVTLHALNEAYRPIYSETFSRGGEEILYFLLIRNENGDLTLIRESAQNPQSSVDSRALQGYNG